MFNLITKIIISCSLVYSYSFNEDDWVIMTGPGEVIAITEDDFLVHFCTEQGIYSYDKTTEDTFFNVKLSSGIKGRVYHFLYDKWRDKFWLITSEGILFRNAIEHSWRQISFFEVGLTSAFDIEEVGVSFDHFWIKKMFGQQFALDPFWPQRLLPYSEVKQGEIDWGYSTNGQAGEDINIWDYSLDFEWKTNSNNSISSDNNELLKTTVKMIDSNNIVWIGTDGGLVFKGWNRSFRLESLRLGLPISPITNIYFDNQSNWWFADSRFKRTGQIKNQLENSYFLSRWDEENNVWYHYASSKYYNIRSTDINDMIRIDNEMYFATMDGILILDINNETWKKIDKKSGLNDNAIWNLSYFDESIYVATANGINEISIFSHSVIPNNDLFDMFNQVEVYDVYSYQMNLVIASQLGLFKVTFYNGSIEKVSEKLIKKIYSDENNLYGLGQDLWLFDDGSNLIRRNISSACIVNNKFAWIIKNNKPKHINIETMDISGLNRQSGMPDTRIYDIGCDDEWVWFASEKGFILFNWMNQSKW